MKIYIHSNYSDIHPSDLFRSIGSIVVVDDARDYKIDTSADYAIYSSHTDEELGMLSDFVLKRIRDQRILNRIRKSCPERYKKFEHIFANTLKGDVARKFSLRQDDIVHILSELKKCSIVRYIPTPTKHKTESFLSDFGITNDDVLNVVHNLKPSDFDNYTKNYEIYPITDEHGHILKDENGETQYDISSLSNILLVFVVRDPITLNNGTTLDGVRVYLKIDYTYATEDGKTLAVLSFHEDDNVKTMQHDKMRRQGKDYPVGEWDVNKSK
jgi:hypothetical protein